LHVLSYAQKQTRALNTRSDTADITNTIIAVTNINKIAKTIEANATLSIKSKINNLQTIYLDLEGLQVDSIFVNNTAANYNYTSPLITIQLASTLNIGDSISTQIYYHGTPLSDPTWGGFYFSGVYAFNMGVGFTAQPHAVGRMLFPCFDNFVERCAFEFYITTANTDMAVCNGELEDSMFNANNEIIWHWKLQECIPSYLTSLAVAPYVFVKKNLNSISGTKELWIACLPADTNKVNGSFANIQQSYNMLEKYFGEYKWNKVGYSLVPFGAGAMEHATNIHIGVAFIDGTLNYETLIAHELSHHWFGDLATCSTAQDMWLNEGFATYLTALSYKYLKSKDEWLDVMRGIRDDVTGVDDGSIFPKDTVQVNRLFNGRLTYNKAAFVLHMLRVKVGDTNFYAACRKYLGGQRAYGFATTGDLKTLMEQESGINLDTFFQRWYMGEGFPYVNINWVQKGAKMQVTVKQKPSNPSVPFFQLALPILFKGKSKDTLITFYPSALEQTFVLQLPIAIDTAAFDPEVTVLTKAAIGGMNQDNTLPNWVVINGNPVTGRFLELTTLNMKVEKLEIFDLNGKKCLETGADFLHVPGKSIKFDIGTLAPGMYMTKIIGNEQQTTLTFIKP
jgi:aminopeptidase N